MKEIYLTKVSAMLKGFGLAMALGLCTTTGLYAQELNLGGLAPVTDPSVEAAPGLVTEGNPTPDDITALWAIQKDINITANASSVGCAGGLYLNHKFWVTKWQSDTVMQFDVNGNLLSKFTIAGLTGIRSLTTDGHYVYAGNNTNTIYRIDSALHVLFPPHITSASANATRHLSYDPTIPGFWTGNFGTDIDAINMSGAVVNSIPASSHGLTAMYGSAYDGYTTGGPYLWIFNQGGANTTQIERITIATGLTTPLASHDVFADFSGSNSLTSGLAGGLFITNSLISGQNTLGGVIQGTPNNVLFAYELADLVLASDDAAASGLRSTQGYTRIPSTQTFAETFTVNATNAGGNNISMMHVDFTVKFGGSTVYTNTQTSNNVGSGSTVTMTSGTFSPASGVGTYDVTAVAYPMVGNDPNHANDTSYFSFMVTDSTYARDDDQPDGGNGYLVSATEPAYALTNFTINRADTLTSIYVEFVNPTAGDTTYAVVASTLSGVPGAVLYTGPVQIVAGNAGMVLPVPGGLPLAAGTYSFGNYEAIATGSLLAQSTNYFTTGMNFFWTPANGFVQSGIQTARFIRPNFGTAVGVGTRDALETKVTLFPNPANNDVFLYFHDHLNADVTVTVVNPLGQVVRALEVNPSVQAQVKFDMAGEANGIYYVRVANGDQSLVRKLVVAH
jgi:hypothetical protein